MKVGSAQWLALDGQDDPPALMRVPTVRVCGLDPGGPLGVCWHWTGGDYARDRGHLDSLALAEWIKTYDRAKDVAASWHLIIDKDGTVIQSAPFNVGTWHVGKSGLVLGRSRHVNRCLIGIELENAGALRVFGGRAYAWPYYVTPGVTPEARTPDARYEVDRARAVPAKGGMFDAFTPAQESSAVAVVRALVARYGWGADSLRFGHRDFDPTRKADPGPVWADTVLPRVLLRVMS